MHGPAPDGAPAALIGPNAVTRIAEATRCRQGEAACQRLFRHAGIEGYLARPPEAMIPEADFARLYRSLFTLQPRDEALKIARQAGWLTGGYLLERRIPHAAQWLLRRLPRPLAARLFAKAIARHAWTFAGSGGFAYRPVAGGLVLTVSGSPACQHLRAAAPSCVYFAATFERLFGGVLGPPVRVREMHCAATGEAACVFTVSWKAVRAPVPAPAPLRPRPGPLAG